MYGRSCRCLLVVLCLILSPAWLRGQSERGKAAEVPADGAPDFSLAFPRALQPAKSDPTSSLRRHLSLETGALSIGQITRAAGTIFSGTVTAITRRPATHGQSVETVAITFHVDNAIRGATPGESLTISQWIGLWSSGQRYRVGERVLLFLYPPSKLGLTSCVAAPMGRFNIDATGRVLLSAQHLSAFRTDPVLGGKSRVSLSDFALAVRQAGGEE